MRRSGKSLKDVKFDVVYTSDLQRTIDTAELLLAENEKTALKRPRRVVKCECSVADYRDGFYHLDRYGDINHFVDEDELK